MSRGNDRESFERKDEGDYRHPFFGNPCEMKAIMELADSGEFRLSRTRPNLSRPSATANTPARSVPSALFRFQQGKTDDHREGELSLPMTTRSLAGCTSY